MVGKVCVSLTCVVVAIAAPSAATAESGKQIKFATAEIERVCDFYANNRTAFDACVEEHHETGVEVVFYEGDTRGPSYVIGVEFCSLNTLEYAPDSPLADADGYYNPCY